MHTLFEFLAEVRGNDCGTSVDFRGCFHGLLWKFAGFHGTCHSSWHFHGKGHGCGHGMCRGSTRGKLRRNNHGNPSTAIATAVLRNCRGNFHGHPRSFPWPSAAIATATRRSPRKSAEVRGKCHGSSADVQPKEIAQPSAAVRGHCHSNPPIMIHII